MLFAISTKRDLIMIDQIISQEPEIFEETKHPKNRKKILLQKIGEIEKRALFTSDFNELDKRELFNLFETYLKLTPKKQNGLLKAILDKNLPTQNQDRENLMRFLNKNPSYIIQIELSMIRKWCISCIAKISRAANPFEVPIYMTSNGETTYPELMEGDHDLLSILSGDEDSEQKETNIFLNVSQEEEIDNDDEKYEYSEQKEEEEIDNDNEKKEVYIIV